MRIHVQNDLSDPLYVISPERWAEAASRAPDIADGHAVSFGGTAAELETALREAELLVTVPGVLLRHFPAAAAPQLRMIFGTMAGVDRLAPFAWLPPGVTLLNNRGAHAKGGEYAAMAMLMLVNHLPQLLANQRAERWEQRHGGVLGGKRATVVGLGTLGGGAATHARHFGMQVTGIRARPGDHPACHRVLAAEALDSVLPETDFLVLACPLTEATRNLIDRRRLELLPEHAGVVNIGRGAVLDDAALCDMLEAGRLAGAVLDVFVEEPIPPGHRLWRTRNLLITPHVSSDDPASYIPRSLDILFDNLRADRDGRKLPNRVDLARGY